MSFDYDTLPTGYYDQIYHKKSGTQSRWHHAKFAHFARAMPAGGAHLDIGCGPGTFIGTLEDGTYASTGIDIAEPQIAYATEHHGGPGRIFTTVAPGPLPFADETFDVVTLIELIEHLPRESAVDLIAEAVRVVRTGGRVLVSTPNYGGAWPWVEKLVNRLGGVDYTDQHITHFDRESLAALMAQAGATDVTVEGYMLYASFAAALSWRLAELMEHCEPAALARRFGLLLFASGTKQDGH